MGDSDVSEKATHEVKFVTFCCVFIPKQLLKETSLLDESYFMYVEDLDCSYRVWKNGYKLYHAISRKRFSSISQGWGKFRRRSFGIFGILVL